MVWCAALVGGAALLGVRPAGGADGAADTAATERSGPSPVTAAAGDAAAGPDTAPVVLRIDIDGTVNPAVADYVEGALEAAQNANAAALLVAINTPGGLLASTRSIVQALLAAPIPVITWVGPPGAQAASAGMFVTLAGTVATMAPGTNMGAATPVGGQGRDVQQEGGEDLAKKVLEDTRAFARSIAEVRDRPRGWMERAVTEAVSATAEEALELGVIEAIAADPRAALQAAAKEPERIGAALAARLAGAEIRVHEMRMGQRIMHRLAHPNIAYLLLLLGMIGIYFELSQPGGFIAGVLGSISLLLAFISMQILPFQVGGLLLILLSVVLFVAEVFVPSFGILALGGFVSFVVGSLILFDSPQMDLGLDPTTVIGAAAAFGGAALAIGYLVLRSQGRPTATGIEGMIGAQAEALTDLEPAGRVFMLGEMWDARLRGGGRVAKGESVRVVDVSGLKLTVEPMTGGAPGGEATEEGP